MQALLAIIYSFEKWKSKIPHYSETYTSISIWKIPKRTRHILEPVNIFITQQTFVFKKFLLLGNLGSGTKCANFLWNGKSNLYKKRFQVFLFLNLEVIDRRIRTVVQLLFLKFRPLQRFCHFGLKTRLDGTASRVNVKSS